MTQERISALLRGYEKALNRLHEALEEDISKGVIVIDGTIRRFKVTFELAWKLLKQVLEFKGISVATPRDSIKESYKAKLIDKGDDWIDLLLDRNKTSHIYDQEQAQKIYNKIRDAHILRFDQLLQAL